MFELYSGLGTSALPEELNEKFVLAVNNMRSNYATATICDYNDRDKCDLHLEPGKFTIISFILLTFEKVQSCHSQLCVNFGKCQEDKSSLNNEIYLPIVSRIFSSMNGPFLFHPW